MACSDFFKTVSLLFLSLLFGGFINLYTSRFYMGWVPLVVLLLIFLWMGYKIISGWSLKKIKISISIPFKPMIFVLIFSLLGGGFVFYHVYELGLLGIFFSLCSALIIFISSFYTFE